MTKALDLNLKKLKARAFHRAEWAEEILRRYHAVLLNVNDGVTQQLQGLYDWMLVPPTLWPFNVQDVPEDCLAALEKEKCLNSRHRLLIDMLPKAPDEIPRLRFLSESVPLGGYAFPPQGNCLSPPSSTTNLLL